MKDLFVNRPHIPLFYNKEDLCVGEYTPSIQWRCVEDVHKPDGNYLKGIYQYKTVISSDLTLLLRMMLSDSGRSEEEVKSNKLRPYRELDAIIDDKKDILGNVFPYSTRKSTRGGQGRKKKKPNKPTITTLESLFCPLIKILEKL